MRFRKRYLSRRWRRFLLELHVILLISAANVQPYILLCLCNASGFLELAESFKHFGRVCTLGTAHKTTKRFRPRTKHLQNSGLQFSIVCQIFWGMLRHESRPVPSWCSVILALR